jgi:ATP-dependent Lon protease
MYLHHKDNKFRQYLKHKSSVKVDWIAPDINFDQLPKVVEVFNVARMEAMMREHERKSNLYRNHNRYLNFLDDTAGFLEFATLPDDIFEQLDDLRFRFPNFSEAIDYYCEQFALCGLSGSQSFSANPLLLGGPPGIGKTAFCHALATIVDTHFELISFSGMTAGFVIGGMSSGWADGKPGKVVEALARGLKANPFIVLDEIDKSGGDKRYDPLGALYQLLEKETAVSFVDEALEIAVNCKHIVWASTANKLDKIAEPILSRFAVLDIKSPDTHQMAMVLRSIYKKVRQSHTWGSKFGKELTPAVIDKIVSCGLEPRLIQRELIAACGKAALRYNKGNLSEDGDYELRPDDFNITGNTKRMPKPVKNHLNLKVLDTAVNQTLPEQAISMWSVREVMCEGSNERTRHLLGDQPDSDMSLVTSSLVSFEPELRRVKTIRGSLYRLEGHSGSNSDVEQFWQYWKDINGVCDDVDVSHLYNVLH